jgi:hypothetical protein
VSLETLGLLVLLARKVILVIVVSAVSLAFAARRVILERVFAARRAILENAVNLVFLVSAVNAGFQANVARRVKLV